MILPDYDPTFSDDDPHSDYAEAESDYWEAASVRELDREQLNDHCWSMWVEAGAPESVEGDDPPAAWELALGETSWHWWTAPELPELPTCPNCEKILELDDDGARCPPCEDLFSSLCTICGAKPRVSAHRCHTCRAYFKRNGRERPPYLSDRQFEFNHRGNGLKNGHVSWSREEWEEELAYTFATFRGLQRRVDEIREEDRRLREQFSTI